MPDLAETHVVTCFLRAGTNVLLLLRSHDVGTYAGKWGAVAGHVEGDPDRSAFREIREETGFEAPDLIRRGEPFEVRDARLGKRWIVHPYLFDVPNRVPKLNRESSKYEWAPPTEILRRDTVPELWTSYRHVGPTPTSIRQDTFHGSAYLSMRAVEALRDRAAELALAATGGVAGDAMSSDAGNQRPPGDSARSASWQELCALAESLLASRPSMTAVHHRVNRVMYAAAQHATPRSVEAAAAEILARAMRTDEQAAATAARLVEGKRVLTLSRSGTVVAALEAAHADVIIAHSLPGGEGRAMAERLAANGVRVAMCSDAGIAAACDHADVVLVGADTVLADGSVVNKVGTRPAALAARARQIPFYVAAAIDKISPKKNVDLEQARRDTLYDGDASIEVIHPLFETTPPELITAIITEEGTIAPSDVADLADELRRLESWHCG